MTDQDYCDYARLVAWRLLMGLSFKIKPALSPDHKNAFLSFPAKPAPLLRMI